MSLAGVNFLAVIVAGILYMVIGAAWYSTYLFGNTWLKLIGKTSEEIEAQSNPMDYLYAFVGALVSAVVLSMVARATGANDLVSGALTGGLMWLGFMVPATLSFSTFAGPPYKVWALYCGYMLVAYLVMGALIGVWR